MEEMARIQWWTQHGPWIFWVGWWVLPELTSFLIPNGVVLKTKTILLKQHYQKHYLYLYFHKSSYQFLSNIKKQAKLQLLYSTVGFIRFWIYEHQLCSSCTVHFILLTIKKNPHFWKPLMGHHCCDGFFILAVWPFEVYQQLFITDSHFQLVILPFLNLFHFQCHWVWSHTLNCCCWQPLSCW